MTQAPSAGRLPRLVALGLLVALLLGAGNMGCGQSKEKTARSSAQRITHRSQLVGGPAARAEVGDYILENDQVRVVIQDLTYNRGSGIFGGSLIDADLKRMNERTDIRGRTGQDSFGELFPAFFLEVVDPEEIEVVNDGSNGEAAVIEVRGRGGEFITMLRLFNQVMVNAYNVKIGDILGGKPATSDGSPLVEFIARYTLEPGARHVKVEGIVRNISRAPLKFPNTTILNALSGFIGLDLGGFTVPAGHVLGFGKLNKPFLPGIGYDLRFGLEDIYQNPIELPAFPGHLTPLVGSSSSSGVSYGFAMTPDEETNFVFKKDKQMNSDGKPYYGGKANPDDMLFLFYASGFGGVFTNEIPAELAPSFCVEGQAAQARCNELYKDCEGDTCDAEVMACMNAYDSCLEQRKALPSEYSFTNYLLIGDGDVSSLWDELYRVRKVKTHTVRGQVIEKLSAQPVDRHTSLLIYNVPKDSTRGKDQWCAQGQTDGFDPVIMNQAYTVEDGRFQFTLPEGKYCVRVRSTGRPLGAMHAFEVSGGDQFLQLAAEPFAALTVRSLDSSGRPVPAKISVVGTHEYVGDNKNPRHFLFDLQVGEPWRTTDFIPDKADDPNTRKYIERIGLIGASGEETIRVRPGKYEIYISRGPEYEVVRKEVELKPGNITVITGAPQHVVDTTGYISSDFHMHARGSIDSGLDYNTRVVSIAAEGLESVVASDHNYITDYDPYITGQGLEPFLRGIIGLELTTFEAGHFNGFPLKYDLSYAARGSFEWQNRPPGQIFEELRQLGSISPRDTIVQVNHPRDSLLGYFSQHNVDGLNTDVELAFNEATGSDKLLAVAVSPNGPAFFEKEGNKYTSTFSWNFDAIEVFNGKRVELIRHFRATKSELRPSYIEHFKEEYFKANNYDADDCTAARDTAGKCDAGTETDMAKCNTARQDVMTCTSTETAAQSDAEQKADAHLARIGDGPVIVCDGEDVAHPGHLDDWYNMLNHDRPYTVLESEKQYIKDPERLAEYEQTKYRKYTATGNSDSHQASGGDEPGYPRNYLYVGHDSPAKLTDQELVSAMHKHHVIVTNGPFINMTIGDTPIGGELSTSENTVKLNLTARAASWVGADRYRIIANGEVAKEGVITLVDGVWNETVELPITRDTWFVLEVEGDNNLFPVISPSEVPPFDLNAAIGSLAGPLGFGGGEGELAPSLTFYVRPFAFTNPIWVIRDGDGAFTPTNEAAAQCQSGLLEDDPANFSALTTQKPRLGSKRRDAVKVPFRLHDHHGRKSIIGRQQGHLRDVRSIFEAWGHEH